MTVSVSLRCNAGRLGDPHSTSSALVIDQILAKPCTSNIETSAVSLNDLNSKIGYIARSAIRFVHSPLQLIFVRSATITPPLSLKGYGRKGVNGSEHYLKP
jgi:hypothetical protein